MSQIQNKPVKDENEKTDLDDRTRVHYRPILDLQENGD